MAERRRLPLTPRQAEAVEAIRRLTASRGYAPSMEELGAALGCSRSAAGRLVAGLR